MEIITHKIAIYLPEIILFTAIPALVAQAQNCPGEGDCCLEHGTPGCQDESCCDAVCAISPYCCNAEWDDFCAEVAWELCENLPCLQNACPGDVNCCEPNDSPSCENESCCSLVCQQDPYCCIVEWDQNCVNNAQILCENLCPTCGDYCYFWADFDQSCSIDLSDLSNLLRNWLRCDCSPANNWCDSLDSDQSGCIDIVDFAAFASQWLFCTDPQDQNCQNACLPE